jgi:diguanylate cyclase (GGDEF)-like protein
MSYRAWFFIWSVFLAGSFLTEIAYLKPSQGESPWLEFFLLTGLATLAQLTEALGPSRQAYYPHLVFFFAGVLLLEPKLFVLLVIVPHVVEWLKKRLTNHETLRAWYIQPFNIATHIIAGSISHWLYNLLETETVVFSTPARVLLIMVIALVYTFVANLLVSLALLLARGISFKQSGLLSIDSLIPEFILAGLGYVTAFLWTINPWLLVPALAPLILMFEALKVPQLKQEAQTDAKTGLLNARHFNNAFKDELDKARRQNQPLTFIMADLDFMRNINNTYGHLAGDAVLAGIGKVMRQTLRTTDLAGRFGGEEFAILLPEVGTEQAQGLAERLREAIATTAFEIPTNPTPIHVTMSVGYACFPKDKLTTTELTQAADVAVYHAKNTGRNRVVGFADVPVSVRMQHALLESNKTYQPEGDSPAESSSEVKAPAEQPAPLTSLATEAALDRSFILQDTLTNLPTRTLFLNHLDSLLQQQPHSSLGLILIDLDRFKSVNSSLGHEAGDQLLIGVAQRLRSCIRHEDTLARLGDDEFIVLLEKTPDEMEMIRVAERLLSVLHLPFMLSNQEIFITASLGLVHSEHGTRRSAELVRDAEIALYRAKAKGRACFEVFSPSMQWYTRERVELEAQLWHALERQEFAVYYQPKVGLLSQRIEGVEALVRWRHPERGLVSPAEFIPVAEEIGLIHPLSKWILREACRQAKIWNNTKSVHEILPVSVNLSAQQFQQPGLVDQIKQILQETELNPAYLQLEITESLLIWEHEAALRILRELKNLGVQLAIDDFGTGYSNLSYLNRFPMDSLKIDRSFTSELCRDQKTRAIVQAIINLGHALQLTVVAEGVEKLEELKQLQELGCEQGQGYYFARPMSGEDLEKLLFPQREPISHSDPVLFG